VEENIRKIDGTYDSVLDKNRDGRVLLQYTFLEERQTRKQFLHDGNSGVYAGM